MLELERLRTRIEPTRQALLAHPIYRRIRGLPQLRLFMQHHVFAVWDFMSLLKALQQRLCCVTVPWVPSSSAFACRLINEIVLGEESDETGQGDPGASEYASHFELYHESMRQCGASTAAIDTFLQRIKQGGAVADALQGEGIDAPVRRFVSQTFAIIDSGDLCAIVSAFTFGREDLLPGLFRRIVEELKGQSPGMLDRFHYYLVRHIDVDDGQHGPMAEKLMAHLCGTDRAKWQSAEEAAVRSLKARLELWNGVSALMESEQ